MKKQELKALFWSLWFKSKLKSNTKFFFCCFVIFLILLTDSLILKVIKLFILTYIKLLLMFLLIDARSSGAI